MFEIIETNKQNGKTKIIKYVEDFFTAVAEVVMLNYEAEEEHKPFHYSYVFIG